MAKYQKYAEYKDSGVEWLGEIPRHWDSKPLKYLCTYNDEVLPETTAKDAEIQYIDIGSVSAVDGISKIETMIFKDAPSRARRIVRDGDVIVSTVRTYLEAIAPINNPPENLIVSTGFAVIRPNQYLYKSFASYCLRAKGFIKEVVARSVGVSYPAINSSDLVNITIPSIEYVEQVKIANFLDHETAKIDSLIAKQEKLIELLKEKRQAVISHAVTKGLNPDVAMKDSGVEWLGQVPEHWEISPIKFILENKDYKRIPLSAEERGNFSGDYRYYGASGVIDYIDDYIFDEPNVLVGEDGANLVNRNTPLAFPAYGKYWVNNHAHILHPQDGLADYWAELIEIIDISPLVSGSAQPKLTAEALKNLKISFPSDMEERKAIDAFIKQQKAKFDLLISKATDQIKLLKERRTALISSAVTGKIDVHNWQHLNEAKTEFSA
ncbi:restriction endonuclease subunit S [Acinetobacter sp. AR2-3]|jgi:type I restriction enzyme S subunit|uniref:restriction endonuclease subunit S n=1 Tax=Acinetobacter sp. AR2-3 TaxID=1891969 RepID=UPI000900142C|nr:restriction endonuclease subunit S [Acinetobacter sp. AR2-3]OIU84037.1 type I restriction endonuclease subunit R [Acinetobacter sp. AR2-3]